MRISHDVSKLPDVASEVLFELGEDLRITYVNRKIEEQFGWDPAELKGKSFLELFPEGSQPAIKMALDAAAKSGGAISLRVAVKSKSGEIVRAQLRVISVELPGKGRGFWGSLHPKGRSYLAEEILDALDSGVVLVDKAGRVLYANRYAKGYLSVVPKLLKALRSPSDEVELDGKTFSVSAKPFSLEGKAEGWTVLFKDITELKRMKEMMTLVDRLSSLGIVAASIAHEIKNPLAGVKLLAQTLQRELEGEKREYAARIAKQVDKVEGMIKKLLSYARPSKPKPKPISVREVVGEVLGLFTERARKQGVSVEVKVPEGLRVVADPNQLQQVLINLVLNALEAMPKGGRLTVEAGVSSIVNPSWGKPYVYLKVADTGVGIPEEALQKIFYPFYSTKPDGTGLGLFVVYQLVRENGGMVEVNSKLGEGTVFTLYLKPENGEGTSR